MKIEIPVFNIESAILAAKSGADRIELCSGLVGGGVTPSKGAFDIARKKIDIPIHVMVRPREGDFLYSETEIEVMKNDIIYAKQIGMDGVVIGCLTPQGKVDVDLLNYLCDIAYPMQVTFHRVIDKTVDIFEAAESVLSTGCTRILTSGGYNTVTKGFSNIEKLHKLFGDKIIILPGGGVNVDNYLLFKEIGIKEIHFSARHEVDGKMVHRPTEPDFGLAGYFDDYCYTLPKESVIKTILEGINTKTGSSK